MKILLIGLLVLASLTAHASNEFEFECSCKGVARCENLSDLSIMIGDKIEGSISSEDGEFNAEFSLRQAKEKVPNKFVGTYNRYTISTRREYLPSFFKTGDILLKKSMLSGGTRIAGPARTKFVGSVVVIQQGGNAVLKYGCTLLRKGYHSNH